MASPPLLAFSPPRRVKAAACPATTARADALVDGELPPSAEAALEAHVRACPACRAYVDALRTLLAAVGRQRARQPAASAALRARVRALAARWRAGGDADPGR